MHKAKLARLNYENYLMTKKYTDNIEVLTISDETLELKLTIDSDLFWFLGHFEKYPILAGVVQIDWVIYYFNKYLDPNKKFNGLVNVKFQQPIMPNEVIYLSINYDKDKSILLFQYEANDVKSKGKMKLK